MRRLSPKEQHQFREYIRALLREEMRAVLTGSTKETMGAPHGSDPDSRKENQTEPTRRRIVKWLPLTIRNKRQADKKDPSHWLVVFTVVIAGATVVQAIAAILNLRAAEEQSSTSKTVAEAARISAQVAEREFTREAQRRAPKISIASEVTWATPKGIPGDRAYTMYIRRPTMATGIGWETSGNGKTVMLPPSGAGGGAYEILRARIVNEGGEMMPSAGFAVTLTYIPAVKQSGGAGRITSPDRTKWITKTWPVYIPDKLYPGDDHTFTFYVVNQNPDDWVRVTFSNKGVVDAFDPKSTVVPIRAISIPFEDTLPPFSPPTAKK